MDLSIIIVNYKSKDFTDACIKSIYDNTRNISFEIIVIDNNSDDGCISMLKEKYPQVKAYQNKENSGFARANNIAIRLSSGRFILLLNPDTIIHDDVLEKMVKFMNHDTDVGIGGCRVEYPDGRLQRSCRRSIPTPTIAFFRFTGLIRLFPKLKTMARYNLSYIRETKQIEVDAVSSTFLMFRNEVLEDIGGLDEDYFMYGEDMDFCYRAKMKGWGVMYYPAVRITHIKGQSGKHDSMRTVKVYYDSMAIFFKKNLERKIFWPLRFLVYFGIWFLKQIAILKVMLKRRKH